MIINYKLIFYNTNVTIKQLLSLIKYTQHGNNRAPPWDDLRPQYKQLLHLTLHKQISCLIKHNRHDNNRVSPGDKHRASYNIN